MSMNQARTTATATATAMRVIWRLARTAQPSAGGGAVVGGVAPGAVPPSDSIPASARCTRERSERPPSVREAVAEKLMTGTSSPTTDVVEAWAWDTHGDEKDGTVAIRCNHAAVDGSSPPKAVKVMAPLMVSPAAAVSPSPPPVELPERVSSHTSLGMTRE